MSAVLCHREDELLDALARGFVGAELAAHIEECLSCAELRVVAGALLDERRGAVVEAPVPTAGAVWLRMQMRQRQEADARAQRSLVMGQAATVVIAIALVASLFGVDIAGLRELAASIRISTPLLLALATWILLAPIAGYVAIRQK